MKKEAIEHLKARLSKQKEIEKGNYISHEEEIAEMVKWVKISVIVAAPVCVLTVAKDLLFIDHPHRKHGPEPDYMRIRNKEFPWECSDCELFNGPCWKKCREEKAAEAAGN
jgi:cytochrome c oxidase subunit 6a